MPAQPRLRIARAVVFATVCLTLTTAGHAYAAHASVPAPAIGIGFLLVTALAALLAGTERSFRTILGGLLGAQFGLHTLFAYATSTTATTSPHMGGNGGVHHPGTVPDAVGGAEHTGAAMALAHLVAAVVAAWWLRRGEAACWSLARRIATAARGPWRLPFAVPSPAAPPARAAGTPTEPPRPTSPAAPLRYALVRRGPPLSTARL